MNSAKTRKLEHWTTVSRFTLCCNHPGGGIQVQLGSGSLPAQLINCSEVFSVLWILTFTELTHTEKEGGLMTRLSTGSDACLLVAVLCANDTDCWIHSLCHHYDFYHIKEKYFCWAWQSWFCNPIPWRGVGEQRQEHQEFKVILTVDWGTAWSAGDPVEKWEAAFENPDS